MNIKLLPNEWVTKLIPISIIKHRLLVTDPTYKFVINGVINARANIGIRRDSDDNDYYDILNMSVIQDAVVSPQHWIDYISNTFNISFNLGNDFQSEVLPELFFEDVESKNIFDSIYNTIQNNMALGSDGINIVLDFNIKLSGGFVRNKLGIDTDNIKNWILDGLNFSVLKAMMVKDSETENFKIKDNFKEIYDLSKYDIELIESVFVKRNSLYPSDDDINIFWSYLDKYMELNSLEAKQNLFGFQFNGTVVSEINTKNVSFALNQYNRPMYIQTQMKFDSGTQRVYITASGPSVPVSTIIVNRSILKRDSILDPSKPIQTKINNHIYMVNKK